MPECHSCPHNQACLRCAGPSLSTHNDGKRFVSIDAGLGRQTKGEVDAALTLPPAVEPDDSPESPRLVLEIFLDMTPENRELVCWCLRNPDAPLKRFAKSHGLSRQTVAKRLRRLSDRCPVFDGALSRRP